MKQLTTLFLLIVIAGSGFFVYERISAFGCQVPFSYRIGTIDEDFGITHDKAELAVEGAEAMWEELVGAELFVYDDEADFTVNFVFDTRQQLTNDEHELREILNEKEHVSDAIRDEHNLLVSEYEVQKARYDARRIAYETDLAAYNEEVEEWNEEGGAPEEEFERLNREQDALSRENRALGDEARELNVLVARINALGEAGAVAVEDYNEDVAEYNNRFNHEYEFTQGDYQGDRINIYQFDSERELRTVLAHELGHALTLQHVDDPKSVMYYLMDVEEHQGDLTTYDLGEYQRACETPWYESISGAMIVPLS